MADETEFVAAAARDLVSMLGMVAVEVGTTSVLPVEADGEVRAYANRCPHEGTPLEYGFLEGGTLTCSNHMWEFDVTTGEGVSPAGCALESYPCRVDSGTVLVAVPTG